MKMEHKGLFVTGIGTGVGKTVVSAILTQALTADYWKPIQAGDLEDTDSDKIRAWVRHPLLETFPERYRLKLPASPHAAAAAEDIAIELVDFMLPHSSQPLVVEGAGGLLVPLNERHTMADLMLYLGLPVVVVASLYLGSINHTLLTIEAMKSRAIPIAGIIFNGQANPASQHIISHLSGVKVWGHIEPAEGVNPAMIRRYAYLLEAPAKAYLGL